ncbi:MAG: arsenate reductase ArsC, partial [Candidatus Omnitrophica bacterium]|nr:arsenate reductase ArsC [Candidatus Omnitrophota bacterium]
MSGLSGKPTVLFVCVENACRSQMAEAFARRAAGDRLDVSSAGSRPRGQVDPTAISIMRERGLDLSRHSSKGFSELPSITWDVLVTMGCGDACPHIPARTRLDWQIPDPARQPLETYRNVRDLIQEQV